jgi:tripartite-type tricarboxylate transporter receptor subunit TctC
MAVTVAWRCVPPLAKLASTAKKLGNAMKPPRRRFLRLAAGAAVLPAVSRVARAQNYPTRTVRLIAGFPAGGSVDVLVRILAEQLKDRLGQPFIVENRPGAGGNLGIVAVTSSPPDGYAIGAATVGQFAINQYLYERMPFDAEKDIIPVSLTWEFPNVLVVATKHVPATTMQEFIAWAKTRGNITFGSPGVGTTPHLSAALFSTRTGINATHVPFRGAAQTIPTMLAGDVTFALDNLASYTGTIEAGQMRALGVTTAERWPTLPNVPTMAEAGLPNFVVTSWGAFVVATGTPGNVIDRLAGAMREIAADPSVQRRFLIAGAKCVSSTPAEARARATNEQPLWREMVRISGAKAE